MKNFIIDCGTFPFDIMVHFGDIELLLKMLKKYKINIDKKQLEDNRVGLSIILPTNQTVLWMKSEPATPFDFSVLQHEIFHCVHHILEKIGIKCKSTNNSDEVYAYLIQYII